MSVRSPSSPLGLVDLVEEELDLRPIGGGRPFGGKSRRVALERQPHLGKPCEVLDVHARNEHPAAGVHVDEPLAGERTQRLSHRRPSEPQLLHQLALADE